ncbi:MAG: hypothetical protein JO115_00105 [Pseudonocardiales bacterium]|nr:hypothetical protein [Pseudonocardiales bacterium]
MTTRSTKREAQHPAGFLSGRDTITWHLPEAWPWLGAFQATHRSPPALAA